MSLNIERRDYFAGLAMQELIIAYGSRPVMEKKEIAELAYAMADAMLEAREKRDYTVK